MRFSSLILIYERPCPYNLFIGSSKKNFSSRKKFRILENGEPGRHIAATKDISPFLGI